MNLKHIFTTSDPVLIAIFLILSIMSFMSCFTILWKSGMIYLEGKQLRYFEHTYNIMQYARAKKDITQKKYGSVALLFNRIEKIKPLLEEKSQLKQQQLTMHLAQELDVIRSYLDKGLTNLASIGSSAPFVGLFGTVWGIYGALTDIATKGHASLDIIAGPMGEALVATAFGLFAAIPSVLAYNTFLRHNKLLLQKLRHIAEQLTLYT